MRVDEAFDVGVVEEAEPGFIARDGFLGIPFLVDGNTALRAAVATRYGVLRYDNDFIVLCLKVESVAVFRIVQVLD